MLYTIDHNYLKKYLLNRFRSFLKKIERKKETYAFYGIGSHSEKILQKEKFNTDFFKGFVSDMQGEFLDHQVITLKEIKKEKIDHIIISTHVYQEEAFHKIQKEYNKNIFKIYSLDDDFFEKKFSRNFSFIFEDVKFSKLLQKSKKLIIYCESIDDYYILNLLKFIKSNIISIKVFSRLKCLFLKELCSRKKWVYDYLHKTFNNDHHQMHEDFLEHVEQRTYKNLKIPGTCYRLSENISFDRLRLFLWTNDQIKNRMLSRFKDNVDNETVIIVSDSFSDDYASQLRKIGANKKCKLIGYQKQLFGQEYHRYFYPRFDALITQYDGDELRIKKTFPEFEKTIFISLSIKEKKKNLQNIGNKTLFISFDLRRQAEFKILMDYIIEKEIKLPIVVFCRTSVKTGISDVFYIKKVYGQKIKLSFKNSSNICKLYNQRVIALQINEHVNELDDSNKIQVFDPFYRLKKTMIMNKTNYKLYHQIKGLFNEL